MSDNNGYEELEEYLNHLQDAEKSLSKALNILYKEGDVRRALGYRIRLGRAQSIVMTLLVREVNRKEGRRRGDASHEWEAVGTGYQCIYCSQYTKPKIVGNRTVFGPDVLRRVPLYGRKWRCDG